LPAGAGGIVAFSRILNDREVLVVANTSATSNWAGAVLVDREINDEGDVFSVAFGNIAPLPPNPLPVRFLDATFWSGGSVSGNGPAACIDIAVLRPSEIVILSPP
jgi:hypothetical protein